MAASSPIVPASPQSAAPGKNDSPAVGKEKEKEKEKEGRASTGANEVAIEDLSMPKSMVQRISKSALPQGTQVQKDAITAMSKSSTVFINQLAAAAQSHTSASGKKTIQPHDVIAGLRDIEFDFMIPHLEAELAKYKEKEASKRNEYKKKSRESKTAEERAGEMTAERQLAEESTAADKSEQMAIREINREKSAKRARGSGGLPVATLEEDEEDDNVETEDVEEEVEELEEEDVGEELEDVVEGDETVQVEEPEDRVGTDTEDRGDETEELEDSD